MPPTAINPNVAIQRHLDRAHDDPGYFNHVFLGGPSFWWQQEEIGQALAKYSNVIVESGNSTGKDFGASRFILWWLFTRPNSLCIAAAPSQTLLGTVLFKEIKRAHARARIPLGGAITDSPNASPQTLRINSYGWQLLGIATKGVERLSGQHDPNSNLFQIVDEASGMDDEAMEALDSQNPRKRLTIGNPIKADGRFCKDAVLAEKQKHDPDRKTCLIIVPSTNSPDIHLEDSPRGLADQKFLRRARETYGEDSLWWRTHILAQRPTVSTEGLLPPEWVDFAVNQIRPEQGYGVQHLTSVRRLACDLGEGVGRDKTVIVVRDDLGVLEVAASAAWGLPEAAAEMARLAKLYNVPDHHCSYDALGIGRDMPNHLHRHGLKARPYRGSASVKGDFANMRSMCAWRLRQRLDPARDDPKFPGQRQIPFCLKMGPWWVQMREEMTEVKYELVGQKVKLENKEDFMIRLGRSPDWFDALAQSWAPL